MKTKVHTYKARLVMFLLAGILFSSCVKDHNYYSVGDFYESLGTIELKSSSLNDFVIHLDDGNNVIPVATSHPWLQLKDNQRVLVEFNPFSDTKLTDSTVTYIANIVNIRSILFKDIKKYTEVSDDSMGHDPILIREAWISHTGGILTLDLKYFTQGSVHYINLIDNGEANGISKPYILELRHNARGDRMEYPASGLVSFRLDYLKLPGKSETNFFIRYTDYEGRRIDLPKTYRY